jgi:formylglycine-generating enzyme required for sulfatase activity
MEMLSRAREQTDELFRLIRPEALYERPIPERHRMIFYLGHLEAFDWNLIGRYALDRPAFHASFDKLFAFGIDPPPGQLPSDQPADWPRAAEVESYNRRVREEIDRWIDEVPEQLLHVAMEHRLMHAETFAYILHQLDYEKKIAPAPQPAAPPNRGPEGADAAPFIPITRGPARLGRTPEEGFGWDNEFPAMCVEVPEFAIAPHKVTNGEYLEFVRQGAAPPFFWARRGGEWFYRGMWRELPLPLDWPVYVTHDEAEAYAAAHGARLPGEAEWHRAACSAQVSENLNFRGWDPIPVYEGDSGLRQLAGNGWEWTSTAFAPFPGFQAFPFYPNYSEPFFDGRHYVLKGASPITARCFLRSSFRNWFRPAYPYVYATFRLVQG